MAPACVCADNIIVATPVNAAVILFVPLVFFAIIHEYIYFVTPNPSPPNPLSPPTPAILPSPPILPPHTENGLSNGLSDVSHNGEWNVVEIGPETSNCRGDCVIRGRLCQRLENPRQCMC